MEFKKEYFKIWSGELPELDEVLNCWSFDSYSADEQTSAALSTFGIFTGDHGMKNIILLCFWKGKGKRDELNELIISFKEKTQCSYCLIEYGEKSITFAQSFRDTGGDAKYIIPPPYEFRGNKIDANTRRIKLSLLNISFLLTERALVKENLEKLDDSNCSLDEYFTSILKYPNLEGCDLNLLNTLTMCIMHVVANYDQKFIKETFNLN